MASNTHPEDVGAPDPELQNSPIVEEGDEDLETIKQEVPGEPVCYFNGKSYSNDTYVKSGSVLLRCDYGVWMAAGPSDPDNP